VFEQKKLSLPLLTLKRKRHGYITKVAGVKIYLRQTWNFRSHAVSACRNHVIALWRHRPMHAVSACSKCMQQPCYCPVTSQADASSKCMQQPCYCPVASQADACSYCMGSIVSISSLIYQLLCKRVLLNLALVKTLFSIVSKFPPNSLSLG